MEEADKDRGVLIIPSGDEEPKDNEESVLDTISADNNDSEMEEEHSVPQLFTKHLLLAAACSEQKVNFSSERKELIMIVFLQVMENHEQASNK